MTPAERIAWIADRRAALRRYWPTAEDLFIVGDRVVLIGALAILFFILTGGIS